MPAARLPGLELRFVLGHEPFVAFPALAVVLGALQVGGATGVQCPVEVALVEEREVDARPGGQAVLGQARVALGVAEHGPDEGQLVEPPAGLVGLLPVGTVGPDELLDVGVEVGSELAAAGGDGDGELRRLRLRSRVAARRPGGGRGRREAPAGAILGVGAVRAAGLRRGWRCHRLRRHVAARSVEQRPALFVTGRLQHRRGGDSPPPLGRLLGVGEGALAGVGEPADTPADDEAHRVPGRLPPGQRLPVEHPARAVLGPEVRPRPLGLRGHGPVLPAAVGWHTLAASVML